VARIAFPRARLSRFHSWPADALRRQSNLSVRATRSRGQHRVQAKDDGATGNIMGSSIHSFTMPLITRAASRTRKESPSSHSHMTHALRVAFTHIEGALAGASEAPQDIHGVIECPFLFYVVTGLLKQLPRTLNKRLLRFRDMLGKFGRVGLKHCGSVEVLPLSTVRGFGNGNVHESLLSRTECYRRSVSYAAFLWERLSILVKRLTKAKSDISPGPALVPSR
jgi:hypothetical protein